MHFAFTEDQLLFRDTVRDILTNECTPASVRASWDSESGRVDGLWSTLADTGVVGLTAPESAGGLAMGEVELVLLLEEAGRAAMPDPLLEHTAVALPALAEADGDVDAWLSGAASGELRLTAGLELNEYVLNVDDADVVVLQHDDTLHAVPVSDISSTRQASVDKSRRLFAVDWEPAETTRIGGAEAVRAATDRGALAAAAECVGVAQQLLDLTVAYVAEREQFGKPVGVNQAVKHHLSNVAIDLEFARPAVHAAAWAVANGRSVDDDGSVSRDVSLAKALASDAVDRACRSSLQCHGAIGYTFEYDLQLWLTRGWALAATWGSASWHRRRLAEELSLG